MPARDPIALLLAAAVAAVVALAARSARATPTSPDGFHRTGSAVQTANHWPFTMDVFAIWHECRDVPATRSRQALVELDADKRFTLRMLRDVDADRLRAGLRDGYHRNGYTDDGRIDRFLSALTGTLPSGKVVWIVYDAPRKTTRLVVDGGATATMDGVAFMEATWSIWLGRSKPSELGDALVRDLP
jgi:hypothetical protein